MRLTSEVNYDSPFKRRNSLLYYRLSVTDSLNPHLWRLLQRANLAYVRIRRITRSKLASTRRGEAALGVVGVLSRASLEDGRLAGCHGSRGSIKMRLKRGMMAAAILRKWFSFCQGDVSFGGIITRLR